MEKEGNVTKKMSEKNLLPEIFQKEASLLESKDPMLPFYLHQPIHQVGP